MSELNMSLIHLSLKFIKNNYSSVSRVSRWIYIELAKFNYEGSKFEKLLIARDTYTIKILINLNKNTDLLTKHLSRFCLTGHIDTVKLFLDNGVSNCTSIHVNSGILIFIYNI